MLAYSVVHRKTELVNKNSREQIAKKENQRRTTDQQHAMSGLAEKQFTELNKKLDTIITDISALQKTGVAAAGDGGGRRARPQFVEEGDGPKQPTPPSGARQGGVTIEGEGGVPPPVKTDEAPKRRGVRIADDETPKAVTPPPKNLGGFAASSHESARQNRKAQAEVKKRRKDFFDQLVFDGEWSDIPQTPGVRCVWLGCAAVAIEFITGKKVTMEDILRNNRLALHYVSFPSVTLAELFDIVDEFIATSDLLKTTNAVCEVATFDSETMDEVGEELNTGDRLPVTSLSHFRRELSESLAQHSVYIFNYDPFVVQEHEIKSVRDDEDEEEGPSSPLIKPQWAKKNMGQFAILLSYNQALHTVTLGTPHLGPDGKTVLETHQCSLQTLYQATVAKDGYSKRSRGFVRIMQNEHAERVPMVFSTAALDGTETNGMLSIALDIAIAPHILGLAIMHNIVRYKLLPETERRRLSSLNQTDIVLRGIPVSEICTVLNLPVHIIVGGSHKDSLRTSFSWYKHFIQTKGLHDVVHCGLIPITRKDDAEDGAASLVDEDFFKHIVELVAAEKTITLINFDINVAMNVGVESGDPSHFALVVGVDEARGIVRLADVSVKKNRKTWHVPITRLYNATIGYGFMVVSTSKAVAEAHTVASTVEQTMTVARYGLPPTAPARFEFPKKNYSVTLLADALNSMKLDFISSVEDMVYHSGFHISFLLSEHIPLCDLCRILRFYSHVRLNDAVSATVRLCDTGLTEDEVKAAVVGALAAGSDKQLIVSYAVPFIQSKGAIWNGSVGGPIARVLGFTDAKNGAEAIVTLQDTNPETFYRTWQCPLSVLFQGMCEEDRISGRSRGYLLVEKAKQDIYDKTQSIDMRAAMVHHPFKPPISSAATAVSLALSHVTKMSISAEQLIYSSKEFALVTVTVAAEFSGIQLLAETATKALCPDVKVETAAEWKTEDELKKVANMSAPSGMPTLLPTATLVLFDRKKLNQGKKVSAAGAAVINRIAGGKVLLCDGNPSKYGGDYEVTVEELKAALLGTLHFSVGGK